MTTDHTISGLGEITRRLRGLLDAIAPDSLDVSVLRVVSPEEMADLLACLMRAGQSLQSATSDQSTAELDIAQYRIEVQRLHRLLPSIHAALLAERSRLEHERERLRAAAAWACSSRNTL
ncbi:MAG TPA: hypothetical protein VGF08_04300 [Terriglobales bacterium]|jgi:hypothetical protein